MDTSDYYREQKWCPACETYVRYLANVKQCYCVHCGTEVCLFSNDDLRQFRAELEERRWKYSHSG